MSATPRLLLAALGLALTGCGRNPASTAAFRPPPGNAENGRAAFIALKCHVCHTVRGADLPAPLVIPGSVIALGGDVHRIRTYGDLLTAIIHPDYALSDQMPPAVRVTTKKSPMPAVNDRMTVAQLLDLIAFLQPRYHQIKPVLDSPY
jgi:mono/diheme cytochrome c family protein